MCVHQSDTEPQVEVTEEMMKAGVTALIECDFRFDTHGEVAASVFRAMIKVFLEKPEKRDVAEVSSLQEG
jgi:hypothetical protein